MILGFDEGQQCGLVFAGDPIADDVEPHAKHRGDAEIERLGGYASRREASTIIDDGFVGVVDGFGFSLACASGWYWFGFGHDW